MIKKNKNVVTKSKRDKKVAPVVIYQYEGVKNVTKFGDFVQILKMTQDELMEYLPSILPAYGYEVVKASTYILGVPKEANGFTPCILTAHLDRHPNQAKKMTTFYELEYTDENGKVRHKLSSPDGICGDDRCGVWSILKVLNETSYRPIVIFNTDEEIGCVGSKSFSKSNYIDLLMELNLKYAIQIDRRGSRDAVFYECDNRDFVDFIEKNTDFIEQPGSWTDICNICPAMGIAGVNLSSGYYNEHSREEYIIVEEIIYTTETVKDLCKLACEETTPQFEYIECQHLPMFDYGCFNSIYGSTEGEDFSWYDIDPNDFYEENIAGVSREIKDDSLLSVKHFNEYNTYYHGIFRYMNEKKSTIVECHEQGSDKIALIGKFLIKHPTLRYEDIISVRFMEPKEYSEYQDVLYFYGEDV